MWVDIYTESNSTDTGTVDVSFPPAVAGNRVRLLVTEGEDNIVRLFELEIYGTPHALTYSDVVPPGNRGAGLGLNRRERTDLVAFHDGSLMSPPWEYRWIPAGPLDEEVIAVTFDSNSGSGRSEARRIVVEPIRWTQATYLGCPETDDALTGVAYWGDGTLIVGGIVDANRLPGAAPVYLNGAVPGDRGVVARLSGDGQSVLSVVWRPQP